MKVLFEKSYTHRPKLFFLYLFHLPYDNTSFIWKPPEENGMGCGCKISHSQGTICVTTRELMQNKTFLQKFYILLCLETYGYLLRCDISVKHRVN